MDRHQLDLKFPLPHAVISPAGPVSGKTRRLWPMGGNQEVEGLIASAASHEMLLGVGLSPIPQRSLVIDCFHPSSPDTVQSRDIRRTGSFLY